MIQSFTARRVLRQILYRAGYYLFKYKKALKSYTLDEEWSKRTEDTLNCTDNEFIPKVPNAGKIIGNYQIMHNDIKIMLGSYYGFGYTKLMEQSKGVHEPQEERAFQEVLKYIPENGTMIELGSYWAFYSIWFNQKIKNARSYMIEPDPLSLVKGKVNFEINKCRGTFFNAYIGRESTVNFDDAPTVCIDDFVKDNNIKHIDILHSDIQGFELEMLEGAIDSIKKGIIDYFFISTHSNEIHHNCKRFLEQNGYEIISSADLDQSFSVDGLIVAKRGSLEGAGKINIHLKIQS